MDKAFKALHYPCWLLDTTGAREANNAQAQPSASSQ
ncbi:hypothetical protein SAMN05446635_7788 [Burkholderia sp. OK233]|nr:hypothetical protein SAMN05446635_7788 [Burkholderia sp. OK233]